MNTKKSDLEAMKTSESTTRTAKSVSVSSTETAKSDTTVNTAIPKSVETKKEEGAKPPKENDVEDFLKELYNTSDDEKIISGLKSKKSHAKLIESDERVEKELKSKTSDVKTAKRLTKPGTSRVTRGNEDLKGKPTVLTFRAIEERPGVARCVLVLCNISDIRLHFTLKSSDGSAIIATYGNGHIAPHAQIRIILTWTRPHKHDNWKDVPQQKLLLATQFLDGKNSEKYEITHTRLMGRVGLSKMCTLANPPVEQLLLDAVGPKSIEIPPPAEQGYNLGRAMADFINNLTDRGLCALIVILAVFVLLACGERRK